MKELTSQEMVGINGGVSPCDVWWGCGAFALAAAGAAGLMSGGLASFFAGELAGAACAYICFNGG